MTSCTTWLENVRGLLMFTDITGTYSQLHWNCQPLCLTASKLFDDWIIKTGLSTIFSWTRQPHAQELWYIQYSIWSRCDLVMTWVWDQRLESVMINLRLFSVTVSCGDRSELLGEQTVCHTHWGGKHSAELQLLHCVFPGVCESDCYSVSVKFPLSNDGLYQAVSRTSNSCAADFVFLFFCFVLLFSSSCFSKSRWCFDTDRHCCLTFKWTPFSFRHTDASTFLQGAEVSKCFSLTHNKWLVSCIRQRGYEQNKRSDGISECKNITGLFCTI